MSRGGLTGFLLSGHGPDSPTIFLGAGVVLPHITLGKWGRQRGLYMF
jgi:hypothetical protein